MNLPAYEALVLDKDPPEGEAIELARSGEADAHIRCSNIQPVKRVKRRDRM